MLTSDRDRETLSSWLSRYASHFQVDVATLCTDKSTSFNAVLRQSDNALMHLRDHGVDVPEEVIAWSPKAADNKQLELCAHRFPARALFFSRSPRLRSLSA